MESIATDALPYQSTSIENNNNTKDHNSAENFQKFIYELFEKNGVLNDLRAYLRGHIVDVLKCAQTGDPPPCQKHFTRRLELTYQALNILVAEYLLCSEFSYSFSVFISEIPLANMVFGFAKTLLQNAYDTNSSLRFNDADVWSILNYLGLKCDSEHAYNAVELYKSKENQPLLLCILKCMPMYKDTVNVEQDISTFDSTSSLKTSDTADEKTKLKSALYYEKCKHYIFCKTCQNRLCRAKDNYMKKRKKMAKTINETKINPLNMGSFTKNICIMEKCFVDEVQSISMFEQLKNVYEAEVEMVKVEEQRKMKRTLATHVTQLQTQHDEMEKAFKARETELEKHVEKKKRFLWGLARHLRSQHGQLTRAMAALRAEAEQLTAKEDSLKTQILEAETVLKKRGEEMREQISNELVILEGHLESMKRERDSIHRERTELQNHKATSETQINHCKQNEDLKSHYDLLKNELGILKKYLETTKMEPKCVMERGTLTDLSGVSSKIGVVLNNEEADRNTLRCDGDERIRAPNQVVNNLKKQKNVNFSQSNLDEMFRPSRDRSRPSVSSEVSVAGGHDRYDCSQSHDCHRGHDCNQGHDGHGHASCDIVQRLRDENDSLKEFAKQQRTHIDDLTCRQARLQAELMSARVQSDAARPRTAPAFMPCTCLTERLNLSSSANTFGYGAGGGEGLTVFSAARPRVLLPGDVLPFVGALRDAKGTKESRRYLINQWRALRRGGVRASRKPATTAVPTPQPLSPTAAISATTPPSTMDPVTAITSIYATTPIPVMSVSPAAPGTSTTLDKEPVSADPTSGKDFKHWQNNAELAEGSSENLPFETISAIQQSKKIDMVLGDHQETRERSPKSTLTEAKQNLKSKEFKRVHPKTTREKSPNSLLKEAKLRLRKLEIEAEAVEKSYLDFRKRQIERKEDRINCKDNSILKNVDKLGIRRKFFQKSDDNYRTQIENTHINYNITSTTMKTDFDKYLCEYRDKFNINVTSPKYKSQVIHKVNPVTDIISTIEKKDMKEKHNYLETPLVEFRKFYHSENFTKPLKTINNPRPTSSIDVEIIKHNFMANDNLKKDMETKIEMFRKDKNEKTGQLEILKENLTKIYNSPRESGLGLINTDNIDDSSSKTTHIIEEHDNVMGEHDLTEKCDDENKKHDGIIEKHGLIKKYDNIIEKYDDLIEKSKNVEEKYDNVMDKSDNVIEKYDVIEEFDNVIKKRDNIIEKRDDVIEKRNDVMEDRDNVIEELNNVIEESDDIVDKRKDVIEKNDVNQKHKDIIEKQNVNEKHDENLSRIKIENVSETNESKLSKHTPQNVSLNVQSVNDARDRLSLSEVEDKEKTSNHMIIIVNPNMSPRDSNLISHQPTRSQNISELSPEQANYQTTSDILDTISPVDQTKHISDTEVQLDVSKDILEKSSDNEKDYIDDISVDVDYHNSRSENNSPISLPKTSEDENFWDS